jgi:hypothetical protein
MASLTFTMTLPSKNDNSFRTGYLTLHRDGKPDLVVRATSGLRGHQYMGNYWESFKSPIPDSSTVSEPYRMNLRWIPAGDQQPLMGSRFYEINPTTIANRTDPGLTREKIGVHYDENYAREPGTAGCIAAEPRTPEDVAAGKPGWNAMKAAFDALKNGGATELPLAVTYTQDTAVA